MGILAIQQPGGGTLAGRGQRTQASQGTWVFYLCVLKTAVSNTENTPPTRSHVAAGLEPEAVFWGLAQLRRAVPSPHGLSRAARCLNTMGHQCGPVIQTQK